MKMKVGSLIECHDGNTAIILQREILHPGHPQSTVRSLVVQFMNNAKPHYSWLSAEGRKISIFSVEKVLSESR